MTMLLIRILLVCALSSVASLALASCLGSGDAEIEALAIQEAKTLPSDHPALLHLQIANLYGADLSPSILENLYELQDQIAKLPAKQSTSLCLKIRLASLMADYDALNGEAFELAGSAYRHADSKEHAWMRAEAASVLSQVTLRTDSRYARILSEEALGYFESQAMHDMAANELLMDAYSWAAEQAHNLFAEAFAQGTN